MITGTHNNTKGIPGKGKAFVDKAFKVLSPDTKYYTLVFNTYLDHFGIDNGIEEFRKSYKLLKILDTHHDFDKSEIINNLVGKKIHLRKKEEAF